MRLSERCRLVLSKGELGRADSHRVAPNVEEIEDLDGVLALLLSLLLEELTDSYWNEQGMSYPRNRGYRTNKRSSGTRVSSGTRRGLA
jgi:hypothetical protein